MNRIIGFCGYAQVGKDKAAEALEAHRRLAFADELKRRAAWALGIAIEELERRKVELRPFLVSLGATARSINPYEWIRHVMYQVDRSILYPHNNLKVTDVRYLNEVEELYKRDATIFYVTRPGYGPANAEEERTIAEILAKYSLPVIHNNGTEEELWKRVKDLTR